MDQSVFCKYTGSDECFVMPGDVTVIAEGAFAKNKILKHIDLTNVSHIGAFAFQECTNLETVIMSNAAVIEKGAFEFCRSLRSVTFGAVTDIEESAFSFCAMLSIPEIPRSLTNVGAGAFSHTAIQRADLHWLEEIPPHLLSYCTSLAYADISGAESIGEGSFEGCRTLSYIRFGDVAKIGSKAFHKCDSLELACLPETLEEIGDDAFTCMRPGTVIPKNVRRVGKNCFGPADRRKSVKIHKSLLYEFRNYFEEEKRGPEEDEEHFYLWESSIDVSVLDDETGVETGFLPLFSDLYPAMRSALTDAFKPDNTFDYSVLDTVFVAEMRWNMKGKDRLAISRLMHPYELAGPTRMYYRDYIRRHSKRIARWAIWMGDIDNLVFLFENDLAGDVNITELIDYSISVSASECTAFLLEKQSESMDCIDLMLDEL
ncbi:MAG: leucine-rich repeat protein [Mogibacterium sp.]|nr:leucine-rich repeat protein [Mogibacterium sp.]